MRSPGSVRLARLAGLIAVVVWIPATVALAQAPSPETPGIAAPAEPEAKAQAARAIPLAEVPERAEATRAELDATLPREASRQRLERIGAELDRTLPEVESCLAKTRDTLTARPNVRTLQELDGELSGMLARLRPWDEELDRQARWASSSSSCSRCSRAWRLSPSSSGRSGVCARSLNIDYSSVAGSSGC